MINGLYKYDSKELNNILSKFTIIVDSREKSHQHVLNFFIKQNIPFISHKLEVGDYSCYLKKDEDLGILRDTYLPICIERKNSLEELAQSFSDRNRFEEEFIRAERYGYKVPLLVEEALGYQKLISGNYQSKYNSKAFLGSLKAFEARYGFSTIFIDKNYTGHYLYYSLLYQAREVVLHGR